MILITGAAGFIGSKVAFRFNELGYETITIDNLSTGKEENIPNKTVFIKGSCGDSEVVNNLDNYKIEGIIHIAGQSSGEVSFESPFYDLESNTISTLLLLDYAKRKGIKKFIFASTMSVYGDSEKMPVKEGDFTIPKSFYACGKLASENYLRIYSNYGIKSTSLRLFNVYGPGQNLDNLKQGMLSIYLAQAVNGGEVIVKGSTNRFRDFVYIDDVVNAFMIVYLRECDEYNEYNICSGQPTKVSDLLNLLKKNLNKEIIIKEKPGTIGDQFGIYGSSDKFKEKYGWMPTTSLQDGLQNMVQWALTNKE